MTEERFKEFVDRYHSRWLAPYSVSREEIFKDIENPDWDVKDRNSWTKLIEDEVIEFWDELSLETKVILYIEARQSCEYDISNGY